MNGDTFARERTASRQTASGSDRYPDIVYAAAKLRCQFSRKRRRPQQGAAAFFSVIVLAVSPPATTGPDEPHQGDNLLRANNKSVRWLLAWQR
jgi:hypothetical protein